MALCLIRTMVHLDTSLFFSGVILLTVHRRLVSGRMLVDDVVKGGRNRGTRDPAEALRHVKHGTGSCQVGFATVLVVKSGLHWPSRVRWWETEENSKWMGTWGGWYHCSYTSLFGPALLETIVSMLARDVTVEFDRQTGAIDTQVARCGNSAYLCLVRDFDLLRAVAE